MKEFQLLLTAIFARLVTMGRLLEKLKVKCRACAHWHIARRISARFLDDERERFLLLQCRRCGHYWQDTAIKKNNSESK